MTVLRCLFLLLHIFSFSAWAGTSGLTVPSWPEPPEHRLILRVDKQSLLPEILEDHVHDADTLAVDLLEPSKRKSEKPSVHEQITLRLWGIDTWEVTGNEKAQGRIAREWFISQILNAETVLVEVYPRPSDGEWLRGRWGRVLATIYLENRDGKRDNLNVLLVEEGHGRYVEY